tara:strand:- start:5680 stop:6030 length:351 start_codon:yes stop_codon:yes gene_type:complete
MRPRAVMTLLDISESTFYRWVQSGSMPQAHYLVMLSVARGLPVLPSRSGQWDGHFFGRSGELRTPTGYGIYPRDLWLFEFANKNGLMEHTKLVTTESFQGAWYGLEAANDDGPRLA